MTKLQQQIERAIKSSKEVGFDLVTRELFKAKASVLEEMAREIREASD